VLGNVERNKALRALVRYSIRKDEAAPKVRDPDSGGSLTPASGSPATSSPPATGSPALDSALGSGARASSPAAD